MGNEEILHRCLMFLISYPVLLLLLLALNCNVCFIVPCSGSRKALTLDLERSHQRGANGATHSVALNFFKDLSARAWCWHKRRYWCKQRLKLCVSVPTRSGWRKQFLSETFIQNANVPHLILEKPTVGPFYSSYAVLLETQKWKRDTHRWAKFD